MEPTLAAAADGRLGVPERVHDVGLLRLAAVLPRVDRTRRGVGVGRRLGAHRPRHDRRQWRRRVRRHVSAAGARTLLFVSTIVLAVGAVGVGVADSFWPAVALLLLAIAAMGVAAPVQQAYVHEVVPSAERATVVSFISMVGSAGGIAGPLGLGYLSRVQSVATGYVVGGLTTLLALPPIVLLRRLREPADSIVGQAGKRGPCAAQGLPEVAAIDATARQPELVP